ncbi:heterokaryon incompatibility protein-domain-containing protein [Schizothecium vesticola]|uniref:Heterokaryon incompatibility protein-domain-containing protein n=1 Tax=Schizothecium vesticola TaxID=314040 RepID=A0AA40BQV2_9PEZI|nr:heterokaryon incompatibility protein-domain-containing protein [Schizothecium vesticola]
MRLLHTTTLEFYEFDVSRAPWFAILSHTWGTQEVTFDDMCGKRAAIENRKGFRKIVGFCEKAREADLEYGWVDTCCIDKRNSTELSEAINSMYRYYARAYECYIYLSDVQVGGDESTLELIRDSKWFTRGWTLQELIAPTRRRLFDANWDPITPEKDGVGIDESLSFAVGVPLDLLTGNKLPSDYCVAERMSWAAKRETTREEDMAYCLLGLFDVHMVAIYGEGGKKAFRRLQMEIMQTCSDQTLFAWRRAEGDVIYQHYRIGGMLAHSPADFERSRGLSIWGPRYLAPFSMTNVGLHVRLVDVTPKTPELDPPPWWMRKETVTAMIQCDIKDEATGQWQGLAVYLEPVNNTAVRINGSFLKAYRRTNYAKWHPVPLAVSNGAPFFDLLVLEDEHYALVIRGRDADRSRFKTEFTSSNPEICERDGFESARAKGEDESLSPGVPPPPAGIASSSSGLNI